MEGITLAWLAVGLAFTLFLRGELAQSVRRPKPPGR